MPGPVLNLDHVTKRFGEVAAVLDASITVEPGLIHAIIGENGAGKSTLLKLAAGALAPNEGSILVDGSPLKPATTAFAARLGVGMVHQQFMLVGAFTALENLILGSEPTLAGGRVDWAAAEGRARGMMKSAGLKVPLHAKTSALTAGDRQRLEILRVLFRGARAILLDEPTAALSPIEAEELYTMLRRLAETGSTIAVVTHKLDEVVRFADRVTVMRRGRVVLSKSLKTDRRKGGGSNNKASEGPPRAVENELTAAIMGGEPLPIFAPATLVEKAIGVLEAKGLTLEDPTGRKVLDGVDLSVRSGEIVGIAGIEGNGQRELVRVLAGLEPRATGRVSVLGKVISGEPHRGEAEARARRPYLGVVHGDREIDGLVLDVSVGENLILGDLGDPREEGAEEGASFDEAAVIARRIERFQIRPPDPAKLARDLSGGNQQKLIVARALDRIVRKKGEAAVILAQPTRGVDVGAAVVIHAAISSAVAAGLAVVVVSADLAELRLLCHRILVMRGGRIVASLPPHASDTAIGQAMLGQESAA
ncbi:MAG TPA: ATP-binding cassette domain-containing protein [Polyangiaceae bacterium]|jgi:simple sugar transport system ATP-binding protein|nr:ATP-binding cassette domain-containing protein [Polyangiaceae bacterium]